MANVKPIPQGMESLTPHITVKNAKEAIEFYKKAFGAQELGPSPYAGWPHHACGAEDRWRASLPE